MKRGLLVVLIFFFVMILIGGFIVGKIILDKESNTDNTEMLDRDGEVQSVSCAGSQGGEVLIDFCSQKSTYQLQEQTFFYYNVTNYLGEPREVGIIIKSSREGYEEFIYDYGTGNLSNSGMKYNTPEFTHSINNSKMAFIIDDTLVSSYRPSFFYEGKYTYLVYIYDCKELLSHNLQCSPNGLIDLSEETFQSLLFWEDEDFEDMITNVPNIATINLDILVEGGRLECVDDSECKQECELCTGGTYVCSSDFTCVECSRRTNCKKGYDCGYGECIPDPNYCEDVSDCFECEGCKPGVVRCKNNKCDYCFSIGERNCLEGYKCEKWGCTDLEILNKMEDCSSEGCGTSDKRRDPEIKCMFSMGLQFNGAKCLECWGPFYDCKEGYHCYNYECVTD